MLQGLLADKGYNCKALRQYYDRYRRQPVIPLGTMKRKPALDCLACSTSLNMLNATLLGGWSVG